MAPLNRAPFVHRVACDFAEVRSELREMIYEVEAAYFVKANKAYAPT